MELEGDGEVSSNVLFWGCGIETFLLHGILCFRAASWKIFTYIAEPLSLLLIFFLSSYLSVK